MFGYVRYDLPNLYVKDLMLYKALYCGLCKGIGESCGQTARIGLSYDVAFLSALLHNLTGTNITVEKQCCFEHAVKKRPVAKTDDLTRELGAFNTVLLYYKLTDDVKDGERGRGKRLWFKRGFRRAKKRYPALVSIVEQFIGVQEKTERAKIASPERAADPTANMMLELSRHFLKEKASESTDELFYHLGKWIYLIDALDDYDKDKKKGNYNPFVLSYGAKDRATLVEEKKEELSFLFDTLFYSLREGLSGCKFYFNRDLTDNVILVGIPAETVRVVRGECRYEMEIKV